MKKIILPLILPIVTLHANVTNEQILEKLDNISKQVQVIDKRVQIIDKRVQTLEQNQKLLKQEMNLRFETIDKRFEMMQHSIDKRFEMMQHSIDKRFETIDKRFEMIQHDMNKRFETLTNFILALTAGIFGLIGFMMWDRRTVIEKAKAEYVKEAKNLDICKDKADKEYVDRLVRAMDELLSLKDETAKIVFKKYGLI